MLDTDPIRNFIRREFLYDREAELGDDDTIFPDLVDSLGVMEVIDFVEETYEIQVDDDELVADNFRSLRSLAQLIERKRA